MGNKAGTIVSYATLFQAGKNEISACLRSNWPQHMILEGTLIGKWERENPLSMIYSSFVDL